jgi:hypothetical protein
MTVGDRLLSLALGTGTNIGLIATPFLRAPGRTVRFLITASLISGAAVSLVWLGQSLADWINTATEYPDRFMKILLALAPSTTAFYTVYGVHVLRLDRGIQTGPAGQARG